MEKMRERDTWGLTLNSIKSALRQQITNVTNSEQSGAATMTGVKLIYGTDPNTAPEAWIQGHSPRARTRRWRGSWLDAVPAITVAQNYRPAVAWRSGCGMEAFWAARLWAGLPDFEEQAAQGYCDDAEATGRLFKRADDVQWSIVELAKIRAENGDTQGANSSMKSLASPKAVLPWARSRPTSGQRTWALMGRAEASGHAG
jgi:hypothetical protein